MNKIIAMLLAALALGLGPASPARANEGGRPWDRFPVERLTDPSALQRGAKYFVNYCLNCHSASMLRYNRLKDIGLTEAQIKDNLLFTGGKVGELMTSAISPADAKVWFGAAPPDLTLVARSRAGAQGSGADYLYTYLRGFYRDDTKATGWNNIAFPSVAMPHAMWQLQGVQRAVFEEEADAHDPKVRTHVFKGFEQVSPGQQTPAQFDSTVADLVAFMQWMSEPVQHQRVRTGVWVMMFLALFTFFAWRMNAAFWKDVK